MVFLDQMFEFLDHMQFIVIVMLIVEYLPYMVFALSMHNVVGYLNV